MSARTLLLEELARAPEGVAQDLLVHLRSLMSSKKVKATVGKDHFETYWNQLYGSLEGFDWNEPPDVLI
jgi:hypothetical protein